MVKGKINLREKIKNHKFEFKRKRNMGEILYKIEYCKKDNISNFCDSNYVIRWLTPQEYQVFNEHLILCNQRPNSHDKWDEIIKEGTMYCGLFFDNKMVARAAVEKYSEDTWEVADVRTANDYRGLGYAQCVCSFVLNYILNNHKNATIRTEEDNYKMQHIICKLGFTAL